MISCEEEKQHRQQQQAYGKDICCCCCLVPCVLLTSFSPRVERKKIQSGGGKRYDSSVSSRGPKSGLTQSTDRRMHLIMKAWVHWRYCPERGSRGAQAESRKGANDLSKEQKKMGKGVARRINAFSRGGQGEKAAESIKAFAVLLYHPVER